MTAFLLSILFSTPVQALAAISLAAAAAAALVLRRPAWVPVALAAALAVHLWSGWLYRSGEAACEARVAAAVESQRLKDEATIAALRRELDRQDEENAAAGRLLAEYEAELKRRGGGCVNTQEDADAINR